MRVQVLGSWSPYPVPKEACSSYIFEFQGRYILIDIGHGSFSKLQEVLDFRKLEAVFVSHLHPDHCADLSCLRHAVLLNSQKESNIKRLPLYIPIQPSEKFQFFEGIDDAFEIHELSEENVGNHIEIGSVSCYSQRMKHPLPTYGFRFECKDGIFVYSADTSYIKKIEDFASGADLFLCEASLTNENIDLAEEKGHLTVKQAAQIAAAADVKKLILTHFSPKTDFEKVKKEASIFQGRLETSREFAIYSN